MGRPVVLHTVKNVVFERVKDLERYFDFHFYFLEIYIVEQSLGWVDEYVVIIDADKQIAENTNLGLTKRLIF